MKILSWNVNGIRAVTQKGFKDFLKKQKPDILCLQETKISGKDIEKNTFDFLDYKEYWHPADRPGYSGTAVLIKKDLIKKCSVKNGFGGKEFDREGRVQIVESEKFFLVNAYFPNAGEGLVRLGYKMKFDSALFGYLKKLEKKKSVVLCGDFNVAHQEIDLANPASNQGSAGFTPEERNWMSKFLKAGFIDTFRHFFPNKVQYSYWTYRFGARSRNVGWRLDYFCASEKIIKNIKKSYILDQIMGSDHCPVGIDLAI